MERQANSLRLPVKVERTIIRYRAGEFIETQNDVVATEYALTIYVNDHEMATIVCSPEYMEDLVVGCFCYLVTAES